MSEFLAVPEYARGWIPPDGLKLNANDECPLCGDTTSAKRFALKFYGSDEVVPEGGWFFTVWYCCYSVCSDNHAYADRDQCDCGECPEHCDCFSCESCTYRGQDICEKCERCERCCGCYTCIRCDERHAETTTVGIDEYCNYCLENYCHYCDECDEWYSDSDSDDHNHGCDCEAPHGAFEFLANGHGTVDQDERLTVQLPKGAISDEGLREISFLVWQAISLAIRDGEPCGIFSYQVESIIEEVGNLWQTKRGNFTRRLSSAMHKKGFKMSPTLISEVGNLARQHSSDENVYCVEFTRDLNQPAECFVHEDSCWFTGGAYGKSRCALKSWGGLAIRSYRNTDVSSDCPSGRAWIQPLDSDLNQTHDTLGAHAFVVYNGYGDMEGYAAARIVAHLTGRTYKKIGFVAGCQYINAGGYLVADEATCAKTTIINIDGEIHDQMDARELENA